MVWNVFAIYSKSNVHIFSVFILANFPRQIRNFKVFQCHASAFLQQIRFVQNLCFTDFHFIFVYHFHRTIDYPNITFNQTSIFFPKLLQFSRRSDWGSVGNAMIKQVTLYGCKRRVLLVFRLQKHVARTFPFASLWQKRSPFRKRLILTKKQVSFIQFSFTLYLDDRFPYSFKFFYIYLNLWNPYYFMYQPRSQDLSRLIRAEPSRTGLSRLCSDTFEQLLAFAASLSGSSLCNIEQVLPFWATFE